MNDDDGVGEDAEQHRQRRYRAAAAGPDAFDRVGLLGGLAALAAFGWWVAGLPGFSGRATGAVLAAGVTAMVTGALTRRGGARAGVGFVRLVPWGLLVALLVVWQMQAYYQHPRAEHPTLSYLANAALEPRLVRALAFAGWIAGAAWLARR